MFGSETRYYVDAEHCSQEMIEKWSEISGWELIGDEFVFPDYGKVRELTMQRDKKPSSVQELLGVGCDSSDDGIKIVGGMISNKCTDKVDSIIIWPTLWIREGVKKR